MVFTCKQCGIKFNRPPSDKPNTCSRLCYDQSREKFRNCDYCHKRFKYLRNKIKRFCSDFCARNWNKGPNHYKWKGGISEQEYRFINKKGKYVREHRVVVEKSIRRKLKSTEVIHHINHNKSDNRLENLMILSRAEHRRIHPPK